MIYSRMQQKKNIYNKYFWGQTQIILKNKEK